MIEQFFDLHSAWVGLAVLVGMLVLFASERFAPVIVAVGGAALMLVLGYLSREEMEQVFANPAPITIAAMFILTGALVRTGVVEALASVAERRTEKSPKASIVEMFSGTMFASALVNNTPVVIILVPVMKRIARLAKMTASKLLIPLSYVSIFGGTLTLISSSTNLLVDGVAQRAGEPAFGIFELTGVGLVAAAVGVVFLLTVGRFLLPKSSDADASENAESLEQRYLSELRVTADSPMIGKTFGSLPVLGRSGVRLVGLERGGQILRGSLTDENVRAGDIILIAANQTELLSLAEVSGPDLGIASRLSDPEGRRVVTAAISPSHPTLGRRLSDVPFLAKTGARVLGISRSRHLPGPTLRQARLRAADQLLIEGSPACIAAIESNVNLINVSVPETRSFRRVHAPIAILTMLGIIFLAAIGVWTIELLAITGVAVVLLTRCIDPEEAWRSIDGNVIVLIFGMLAVGLGLQGAGTIDLMVGAVLPAITALSPFVLLLAIYLLT